MWVSGVEILILRMLMMLMVVIECELRVMMHVVEVLNVK